MRLWQEKDLVDFAAARVEDDGLSDDEAEDEEDEDLEEDSSMWTQLHTVQRVLMSPI